MRKILLIAFALFLVGCQSRAQLTIKSQPEGAYITDSRGQGMMAPTTYYYEINPKIHPPDSSGCWRVKGFTAQWASGARYSQEVVRLCGSPTGSYTITAQRPQNAPNLHVDLSFQMQLQSQRAAAKAAKASQSLAAWAAFTALQNSTAPQSNTNTYIMPNGRMYNCTNTGNVTNCY